MAVLVSNCEGSGIEGVGACSQKMKNLSMEYLIKILPNQAQKNAKKFPQQYDLSVIFF